MGTAYSLTLLRAVVGSYGRSSNRSATGRVTRARGGFSKPQPRSVFDFRVFRYSSENVSVDGGRSIVRAIYSMYVRL